MLTSSALKHTAATVFAALTALVLTVALSGLVAKKAHADTGSPFGPLTAVFDATTGQLTVSGLYAGASDSDKKVPGVAVFVNGANPDTDLADGRVLSKTVQLLPAGSISGSFTNVSSVSAKPQSVCVVLYDVHLDKKKGTPVASGNHSIIPSGRNHNSDSSFDENRNAYHTLDCTTNITGGIVVPY